jgi:hypothetical protein
MAGARARAGVAGSRAHDDSIAQQGMPKDIPAGMCYLAKGSSTGG